MRVFARDTIKNMMGRFGIPEDEPIENRIITRSLETAQQKIEGFNFDARKHVLEYDNVLNLQRTTIYDRRRTILLGGPKAVDEYLATVFSQGSTLDREKGQTLPDPRSDLESGKRSDLDRFGGVIEQKRHHLGADFYPAIQRLILQTIDLFWVEHLEVMDYLRGSVNLRAYGQRDPLVEYKKEGLKLFKEMEGNIVAQVMNILPHVAVAPQGLTLNREKGQTLFGSRLQEVHEQAQLIGSGDEESDAKHQGNVSQGLTRSDLGSGKRSDLVGRTSTGEKVGRNDPCPCGSGKKYKKCHGA